MYEYRCRQCSHRFEKIQSFSAAPETVCPLCKGELYRPLTTPGFNFKGAGWYVNDYASKPSSASVPSAENTSASTPAVAASESKPAVTPAAPAVTTSTNS
jgi:putative FmdB family regulatory protein